MSTVDQGLDAAVQRVMRAIGCVRSGESWDGYRCMWHAGLFWDVEADACPEALDAARAAREDVPALTQQARADADAYWRALVNGIAIGARATGNRDRERAALDILAIDERAAIREGGQ